MPLSNKQKQANSRQRKKEELERLREVERIFNSARAEDLIDRIAKATNEELVQLQIAIASEQESRRRATETDLPSGNRYSGNKLFGAF